MVVGIKDSVKLIGISIIACCATLVCTMFLNFYFDIVQIEDKIISEQVMQFYSAQVSTAKVVCCVSGGCLLITSVVMLFFYIKHYIDIHKPELGILKALGYSEPKIAKNFWVFGISVFWGTAVGFGGAFAVMPSFYSLQNKENILPEIAICFHPSLLFYFVVLPTAVFSVLAVLYAYFKLKEPALTLLKKNPYASKTKKCRERADKTFISDLKYNTLRSKKSLVFFIIFSSFCFSAMTQMSFSMKDLASEMMGAMILLIGLVLAFVTLFLAVTAVIAGNVKTIALMRAFGYSHKESCGALLGCYRPLSYIGFALGTVYQYVLLRVMVDIVFKDIENVPAYQFDFSMALLSLACFVLAYETIMYRCAAKIRKISIKEIMLN